ncbi:MAG: type II toxin-antitoxin system VapC family toxin [Bryobacteraceae bacterium]|jgi:ribonuclease VapC
MVIDSSAFLAILFEEPEAEAFARAIASDPVRLMSAVSWLETVLVAEGRLGAESADDALLILNDLEIQAVPFDLEQMRESRRAWRRFGKGKHPAGLNLSDCCSYALASTRSEPLLFKGNDFSRTDIPPAAW